MNKPSNRLSHIQTDLQCWLSADTSADAFEDINERLLALAEGVAVLQESVSTLSEVNGALEVVLQLLFDAEAEKISCNHLYCLMEPIQGKLDGALERMGGVI